MHFLQFSVIYVIEIVHKGLYMSRIIILYFIFMYLLLCILLLCITLLSCIYNCITIFFSLKDLAFEMWFNCNNTDTVLSSVWHFVNLSQVLVWSSLLSFLEGRGISANLVELLRSIQCMAFCDGSPSRLIHWTFAQWRDWAVVISFWWLTQMLCVSWCDSTSRI